MNRTRTIILSTIVPLSIMGLILLIAGIVCGVGYSSNDCFEQYIPFFNAYYDILKSGKSMFYSLTGSMGYDFFAVFSYYLVSPLNFIMLLFPKEWIIYVVNALIVVKIGLCGLGFSVFITNRFKGAKTSRVVLFSTIYALSGFVAGYFWNIMWLDGVLLFPLVLWGLDLLMEDENPKWYIYTAFLAVQVVTSYFVGYMTCIFIFMYFFTYDFKGAKDFFRKFVRIGLASVLAIAISAVILLPSFSGVQSTYISGEELPGLSFYGSYAESFATMFTGVAPIGIEFDRQYANLFMTSFALLMGFMFFVNGRIKLSRKLRYGLVLFVILFSFNFKPLNFLWHGLHEQTGIPNRFAFMAIFMMLAMGFEVGQLKRDEVKRRDVWIALGVYALCAAVICFFNRKVIIMGAVSVGMCLVYALFLQLRKSTKRGVLISIFAYGELVITFVYALATCSGSLIGDYGYYINDFRRINGTKEPGIYREKLDEVYNEDEIFFEQEMDYIALQDISFDKIKEYCNLMRGVGHQYVVNEATVYGLNSLSLFNTFNNYAQTEFYNNTGNAGGTNNVMYFGDNPLMDMMLGVKYSYIRFADNAGANYKHLRQVGKVDVYENIYALSVGYAVSDELINVKLGTSSDFDNLNKIAQSIVGEDIYRKVDFAVTEDSGATTGIKEFHYKAFRDGDFVIQPDIDKVGYYEVKVNGESRFKSQRNACIFALGELNSGDEVTLRVKLEEPGAYYGAVHGAYVDMPVVEAIYEVLSKEQLVVTDFSESAVSGKISLSETSKVLITIPEAKGWSLKVDGVDYEPELFMNLFYVLNLQAGEHSIKMNYITPGFFNGLYITLTGIAIYIIATIVTVIINARKKKSEE